MTGSGPVTQVMANKNNTPTCSGRKLVRKALELFKNEAMPLRSCSSESSYDAWKEIQFGSYNDERSIEASPGYGSAHILAMNVDKLWFAGGGLPSFLCTEGLLESYDATGAFLEAEPIPMEHCSHFFCRMQPLTF